MAGLLAGVITYAVAQSGWDNAKADCVNGACAPANVSQLASAHELGAASAITLVASGVALGTGAIVFFTAPKSRTSAGATVGLGPAAEGTGLSFAERSEAHRRCERPRSLR